MKNRLFGILIFLLLISTGTFSQDGKFTFTISSSVNTSAGVFKTNGTLVRKLWSNVRYTSGTYTEFWDGKDDSGVKISSPDASYQVKVLSNNVDYIWQGTIGNSSDSMTGDTKHQTYYNCMTGLAFASNGYGYFCNGFSEGESSYSKFLASTPQKRVNLYPYYPGRVITLNTEFVATDNINVYWGGFDSYDNTNSMVHAIRTSDDSDVLFTSGVSYAVTYGVTLPRVISKVNLAGSRITGLAVQKSGSYLFVARSALNQLQVLNKTTGALVQTLTYTKPRAICVDASDNIWMITGTKTISKHTVNSNGTLSTAIITLSGLLDPLALQVSSDGSKIVVADGSTSQQIKSFNNSTGVASWTLGTLGGYVPDPTVNNNKFYLSDSNTTTDPVFMPFVAFQPDGSFWVNDPGNYRVQHYNSSQVFMNRIMFLGSSYSTFVDPNNPTKVFAGALEFSVDYNANLTGTTGWTLVKNWGAIITDTYSKPNLLYPTTLSNGKTYAILVKPGGVKNREIVELPASGKLRFTGVYRTGSQIMAPDGAIQTLIKGNIGGVSTIERYALTGFDASNNPTWSSTPEIIATTPTLTLKDPNDILTGNCITSTNKVIFWNPDTEVNATTPYDGHHLGAIARGGKTWLWKTEQATHTAYQGPYPPVGYFDIGNGVHNNAGGTLSVLGRNLITSYHGEFWKNTQTNKYNHYYDNGLAIGQFGLVKDETIGNGPAGFCGNALTPMVVADPASPNSMYLYHGDESTHSGVHRWKITGLNTISEQSVTIPFPSAYVTPATNYVNLMAGLPFASTLVNNTAGWTRYPLKDSTSTPGVIWEVNTSRNSYQSLTSNDLTVSFENTKVATFTVSRDLGTNNVTNSWKISGEVNFPSTNNPNGQFGQQFLEVLDANGKVLTTFYFNAYQTFGLFGNTAFIGSSPGTYNLFPFEVKMVSGIVTFSVAGYPTVTTNISDSSGNWKTPKTLRVKMLRNSLSNPARYQTIVIKDFKFYKDYLPGGNVAPVYNSGPDKVITIPTDSVTLAGSGTDANGTVVSYAWVKTAGPSSGTIVTPGAATTKLNNLVPGIYKYQLVVTDNAEAIGKDTVQVTVNVAPVSNAGANQLITLPTNSVTLTGAGTDTDGTIDGYAWVRISGPSSGTIANPGAATTVVNNLAAGVYQYQLTVTDNHGAINKDTVQITVNIPPVSNAGPDKLIDLPTNSVTLTGTGSDADGTVISYAWSKISGPSSAGTIASPDTEVTAINSLLKGVYRYQLTVTDNQGGVTRDTVLITVNVVPVANAGTDKIITLPTNSSTLSGTGTDTDGTISSYAWIKISGPSAGTISNANAAATAINSLAPGIYLYELTVTDNNNATDTDTVQVRVNIPPVSTAGPDQLISLPTNSITLAGTGSDVDGTVSSTVWLKISGPTNGTIASPGTVTTTVSGLVKAIYKFQLTVTDNHGGIARDTVVITVNTPPVANAGNDKAISLPANSTTLTGTATDADGTISSYSWAKISGPSAGNIVTPGAATTTINNLVNGTYQFQLTVTDNRGATGTDIVLIKVNVPPLSYAGTDQTIFLPSSSTTISGSGTDSDGIITTYTWKRIVGASTVIIASPNAATTAINNLVQGTYTFQLEVKDDNGATGKDTIRITVGVAVNQAPVANAGIDKVIVLPTNSATLTGTGTDADGSVSSYAWAKISGPSTGTIASPGAANTTINSLVQGTYLFRLTVTDDNGATGRDTIQVKVGYVANQAPVSNAGSDKVITLPTNSVTVTGAGTDTDGTVSSYAWVKISGPSSGTIASPNAATTSINSLVEGVYKYQLTVTDNNGASDKDTVQVTVNAAVTSSVNQAPVANAGTNRAITLPTNSATLTGTGTDPDGTISAYAWVKISGPSSGTIGTANNAVTTVNSLVQGIYQYQLTVTDNDGATDKDTVQVTVNAANNIPPVANAGGNKTITLPVNSTTLTGSGTDADGTITAYAWAKVSGPSSGTIGTSNAASTTVNSLVQGIYKYQLTVTDNDGSIGIDTVQVTVNAATNLAPVANAGNNKTITLPTNSTTLTGTGTDTDGTISSYAWVQVSGPSSGTIGIANAASTTVNSLVQGVYQYQLTVTDNDGAIDKDTVEVTVISSANQPPVANAGSNKLIVLPTNSTTLTGAGTDADGNISSYAWAKVSGPSTGTIATANAATTTLNSLVQGVYQYQLIVTDNNGAIGKDTVQVTVNIAPVSNAGTDQIVTLPTSSTTLIGSGTDADGKIVSYSWAKMGGPGINDISTPTASSTVISSLVEGVYTYRLTVKDDKGTKSTDDVRVTVNAATVLPRAAVNSSSISLYQPVNELRIYPNPVTGIANLQIALADKNDKLSISVYNTLGMLVKYKELSAPRGNKLYKLDMSGLDNGIYFIVIRFDDGQQIQEKILKNG